MSSNNPFVGLRPFGSDESLLFFGRQEQTMGLLERLHKYHFVAVTGSSGSGKSSLIKAGLIPRLKAGYLVNERDHWVISSMKPGQCPLYNLADAILTQLNPANDDLGTQALEEKIKRRGVDALIDLLEPLWKLNTNFFLLIDQFEELFRFFLSQKDIDKKDEAIDFVNILLELTAEINLPIYIVITMRSDFTGDCSQFYGLPEAMNEAQYLVPRLNRIQLRNTIEGPVRLSGVAINAALTARLLNDAQVVKDELPLLQHALMRIWDYKNNLSDGSELNLDDYEAIGGIERALCNHADEALKGMSAKELDLTKKIFQLLTTVDDHGRKIRRPAHTSELEAHTGADREMLLAIMNRFIEDNKCFLVINKIPDKDDLLIDISHESLIRQWNILSGWVEEEAAAGNIIERLSESAQLYNENKKDLLTGNELQQFLHWYNSFKPGPVWAKRYSPDYENNIRYLTLSEKNEKKQHQKKIRNRRFLLISLLIIIVVIGGFALTIYKNDIKNKRELALNYWKSGQDKKHEGNLLDGLLLLSEAAGITSDENLIKNFLVDGESFLPITRLENIYPRNDFVNSVVFSSDGKLVLFAENDGSARILDKITGKQTVPAMKHQSPVNSAVFSTNNKFVLTTGNDKKARIWDAFTGKQLHSFMHEEQVTCADFSPDGKFILTGSSDGYARTWQILNEKQVDSFKHSAEIKSAVYNPSGTSILTTCSDGFFHIWNLAAKKELGIKRPLADNDYGIVTHALYNRAGSNIVSINSDSTVRTWDTAGRQLSILKHPARVNDAVFSPDGRWLLSGCEDKLSRLWDASTGLQLGVEMKHEGSVNALAFAPDGKQLLTAGLDKVIRLWSIALINKTKEKYFKHGGKITGVNFSPDGSKILSIGYDSTLCVWNVFTGAKSASVKHSGWIVDAVFNRDGTQIRTVCNDATVRILEADPVKKIALFTLKTKVDRAVFSSGGDWLLTCGDDNYARIWNMSPGHEPATADSFKVMTNDHINGAALSSDRKFMAIMTADSVLHSIDIASGKALPDINPGLGLNSIAFSPDGSRLLTTGFDWTARIWDVDSGRQIGPSMKHTAEANCAVYSPDGNWIVTAGWDKEAHLWNTITLKESGFSKNHGAPVNTVVFSPDSKRILTGGHDSTARLWEIEGDLDLPGSLFKLQANAITGVTYETQTSETRCISSDDWSASMKRYNNMAKDHYKICRYPQYNLWRRFNNTEAQKIRPGE